MRDAMVQAAAIETGAAGPVVITDAADNVGGGTPGDTPGVLRELLVHRDLFGLDDLAFLHVPDPSAIAAIGDAVVGSTVTVAVGGKLDTSFGDPVEVEGTVLARVDGPIENCAPGGAFGGTGPTIETGLLVCIAVGNVRLVLSERKVQGPHPSIFTTVGLDPFGASTKVVVLKSGTGWQTTYEGKCAAMIRADCPGPMNYNVASFPWEQVTSHRW
jgi:microcystin degradation protein MlrC